MTERNGEPENGGIQGDGKFVDHVQTNGGSTYVFEHATYFVGSTGTIDEVYRDPKALYDDLIAQGVSPREAQELAQEQNRRNFGF